MPVPQWQPGTTYAPGALVVPRSSAPPTFVDLTNPSLTDTTGWDLGAPMAILADGQGYAGKGRIYLPSTTSGAIALNQSHIPVNAGQVILTSAMMKHATAADSHSSDGSMQIHWYKADDTEIQPPTAGNGMPSLSSSDWQKVEASGPAPAGVAYCRIGVGMYRNSTDTIQASSFGVFYTPQTAARATMYKATQPKPGKSANTEPTWPPLGQSVTDNQVIWEGVNIDRLVWQASPLLTSGATEPTWPNAPGTVVHDGTIDWVGTVPYITDPNCPNTPVVAIMASKVFAADKDIVRFCATANALDWTSEQDAGYLPTGLQQSNSNDMAVLAPYRGNLTAFNASAFQNWQVDPDPAAMALLDQMEGIGSIWRLAAQPVGNELFYLSQLGVRSVSVAAGGDNLQNGDIGMPVDSLVQVAIKDAVANGGVPRATYYPGAGQYWLAISGYPPDELVISGAMPEATVGDVVDFTYTVTGGVLPYGNLTVTDGAFPGGLTVDASGHVTGTITGAGTFNPTLSVTDAAGTAAILQDTIKVKTVDWWLTASGDPSHIWISKDPRTWSAAPATVSPVTVTPGFGAKWMGDDVALIIGPNAGIARTTTLSGGPITTTVTTIGANTNVVWADKDAYAASNGTSTWYTSVDQGVTWQAHADPDGLRVSSIVRLASGRWVAYREFGSTQALGYSDEKVPTAWAVGLATSTIAEHIIVTNGAVAVVQTASGVARTTDGAAWAQVAATPILSEPRCGFAHGDTMIIVGQPSGAGPGIWRSADAGLTWAAANAPATTYARVEYASGYWVASQPAGPPVVSTDDGLTWVAGSVPATTGTLSAGFVEYVP